VCREDLARPVLTWCGHVFCANCITKWIDKKGAVSCRSNLRCALRLSLGSLCLRSLIFCVCGSARRAA
jgi:hypothetical protein